MSTIPSIDEEIKDLERPRGILSKKDRRFLLDGDYRSSLEAQSQRNTRARIRERFRHSILDFWLLERYIEERDLEHVFSDPDDPLTEGIHSVLGMLIQASENGDESFESWLEGGLIHQELGQGSRLLVEPPRVELSIEPASSVDPETAMAKLEAGEIEELSRAELRYMLWRAGKQFSGAESDGSFFGLLTEFVERFERNSRIAHAREAGELLEDDTLEGA